ncbi:MAG: hypothetical protein Q4D96_03590 [Propionibacteriaceae bacterium]|nr:hypothetical protein [Propionibacteriaceae bacterium]
MRKLLVTTVFAALVVVGAVGCGQSVDEARAEAAARVAQMLYLEDLEAVQAGLEDAATVEEVRKLAEKAEKEDQERGEAYWSCAAKAVQALPGTAWEADAWHDDGSWDVVVLHLKVDATATLERTASHLPFGSSSSPTAPPSEMDTWLSENAEKVSGWSSDVADRVASRSVLDGQPPHFSVVNKSCTVQFMLTLVTATGAVQFPAKLEIHAHLNLVVNGKDTSRKEG